MTRRMSEIEEIEEVLEKIELFELQKKGEEEEKVEVEEKVEEENDYDYEMITIKMSTWINGVDATISQGVVLIDNDDFNKNTPQEECPICFESLANHGNHRICCLPCGHIYGFSCINKWLRQPSSSSRRCPQCNKSCTFKNIKRLSVPAQTNLHKMQASTTHFPFTKQGYKAFKLHVSQIRSDVSRVFEDVEKRRVHTYRWHSDISYRLANLFAKMADAQGLVDSLGHRDDALGIRANQLGVRIKLLYPLVDALELRAAAILRLADAMQQRAEALIRRDSSNTENIRFFREAYKNHTSLAINNANNQQVLPKTEF